MSAQGMAYRGADRRRAASSNTLPHSVAAGAVGLLVIMAGVWFLTARNIRLPADRADRIDDLARMMIPVGAGAAYATCLVRWRLTGAATVLWIANAIVVFGVVVVGTSSVALPILLSHTNHPVWVAATRASGMLLAAGLLVLALVMPPVDVRVGPWRLGLAVAGAVGVLTVVLAALPAVAGVLGFGRRATAIAGRPTNLHWAIAALVSTALAVPFLWRGLRLRYPLMAWTGLALVAVALGDVAAAAVTNTRDLWILGHQALLAAGMLFVLIGSVADIESVFADQRLRLFDTEITVEAAQMHRNLGLAGASRRTHDVRSALMAVEGAAVTLERHFDHLKPDEREKLTSLLGSGVDRLKRLVGDDTAGFVRFDVGDVVTTFARELENEGVEVRVEVPEGLAATGWVAETTEVLRTVAAVARHNGGPVSISAGVVEGTVVIGVGNDRLLDGQLPALLAERRPPWEHADGLHLAERLMRDQDGELGVSAPSSGAPLFLLRLPAAVDEGPNGPARA